MMQRGWSIVCRVIGTLVIAAAIVTAYTPAMNVLAQRLAVSPDIGPADAIVVLAVSINRDGSLGDASVLRALAGIQLYRDGRARRIALLGMRGEAEERARLATGLGIPAADIVTETSAPTTRAEAERMRIALRDGLGVRSVLLVTDLFHMRRARALFEREGFLVRPATIGMAALTGRTPESRLRLARGVGQELVAGLYQKLLHSQ